MKSPVKKPRTGYNFFFHHARQDLQKQVLHETGKKAQYTDISKLVSARWRKTTPYEKAPFQEMAARDKRRYGLETLRARQEEESNRDTNAGRETEDHRSDVIGAYRAAGEEASHHDTEDHSVTIGDYHAARNSMIPPRGTISDRSVSIGSHSGRSESIQTYQDSSTPAPAVVSILMRLLEQHPQVANELVQLISQEAQQNGNGPTRGVSTTATSPDGCITRNIFDQVNLPPQGHSAEFYTHH